MQTAAIELSKLARFLNITERRVQQLAKQGVVAKSGRGQYDLIASLQGYIRYLQDNNQPGETLECNQERAKLYQLQTKLKAKELAQLEQALIPMTMVEDVWAGIVTNAKTKFLSLPKALAPVAVGYNNPIALEEYLYDAIHDILSELAHDKSALDFTEQGPSSLDATAETSH